MKKKLSTTAKLPFYKEVVSQLTTTPALAIGHALLHMTTSTPLCETL